MDPAQKAEHESFIHSSDNGGSSMPFEVLLLSVSGMVLPLWVYGMARQIFDMPKEVFGVRSVLTEFSLLILPLLLNLTCLSEPPWSFLPLAVLSFAALVFFLFLTTDKSHRASAVQEKVVKGAGGGVKDAMAAAAAFGKGGKSWFGRRVREMVISQPRNLPFVTTYRSGMLLTTAGCILAVDFQVFPRRFSKTETFGYGLMDIGVGSFVFAGGLVSQEARKGAEEAKKSLSYLKKSLMECVPLLVLGFVRLASVKGSGYHEHVTEYGVHWNFFFTLAFAKLFSSLVFLVLSPDWSWIASIIISVTQEAALVSGLGPWALTPEDVAPRSLSLIYANREGLVSIPGYVALYLAGVAVGGRLRNLDSTFEGHLSEATKIFVFAAAMWGSLFYSQKELFDPPSRRLANWNYFNWMVAYNITLLLLFMLVDLVIVYSAEEYAKGARVAAKIKAGGGSKPRRPNQASKSQSSSKPHKQQQQVEAEAPAPTTKDLPYMSLRVPALFAAVSYNGLFYFLLANVLTGAVNFSVNTLTVSACPAVLIVAGYMLVTQAAAVGCYAKRWKMKVW